MWSKYGPAWWFFTFEQSFFCLFQLPKTLHKVIFNNFFRATSGSALQEKLVPRKSAGSWSAKNECGSTGLVPTQEGGHDGDDDGADRRQVSQPAAQDPTQRVRHPCTISIHFCCCCVVELLLLSPPPPGVWRFPFLRRAIYWIFFTVLSRMLVFEPVWPRPQPSAILLSYIPSLLSYSPRLIKLHPITVELQPQPYWDTSLPCWATPQIYWATSLPCWVTPQIYWATSHHCWAAP